MTATQEKAAEAWAMMVRPANPLARVMPMPPAVALDYVQDVCGDRDEAVTALCGAAAGWLLLRVPIKPEKGDVWADEYDPLCRDDARHVSECLGAESSLAAVFVEHINERVWARTAADALLRDAWRLWVRDARAAIDFARQLVAAAWPD